MAKKDRGNNTITPLYAKIRCAMETQGTPMGQMDLMIAAQALQAEAILVTQNPKPFSHVPDLKLELWGDG
jgi:tRNA(fMet)-specific endonuclease VapC